MFQKFCEEELPVKLKSAQGCLPLISHQKFAVSSYTLTTARLTDREMKACQS
jgi:hypothetical protein